MSQGNWIVENQWRCATCGTVNPGREIRCTQCGKLKEQQEAYDASGAAQAQAVQDPRLLAMAQAGENWTCPFCQYQQRGAHTACQHCGAERPSPQAAAAPGQPGAVMPAPGQGLQAPVVVPVGQGGPAAPVVVPAPPAKKSMAGVGCLALIVLACVGAGIAFWPHKGTATVSGVGWKTTTRLEERTVRNGQGFRSAMPTGARTTSCEQRANGTTPCNPYPCVVPANGQCNPHECNCQNQCRDLGNGFSECQRVCQTCYDTCQVGQQSTCYQQCPRMEDFCRYEYDDWRTLQTRELRGTDASPRYAAELAADTPDRRVQTDTELTVSFAVGGEMREYHPANVAELGRFRQGQAWEVTTTMAGGITPVRPK